MLYCKQTISTYSIGTRMAACKIEASAAYYHVLKLVCSSSASRVCRESLDQRETLDLMERKEQWLNIINIHIYFKYAGKGLKSFLGARHKTLLLF